MRPKLHTFHLEDMWRIRTLLYFAWMSHSKGRNSKGRISMGIISREVLRRALFVLFFAIRTSLQVSIDFLACVVASLFFIKKTSSNLSSPSFSKIALFERSKFRSCLFIIQYRLSESIFLKLCLCVDICQHFRKKLSAMLTLSLIFNSIHICFFMYLAVSFRYCSGQEKSRG